jgi:hypothetical protein
MSRQIGGESSSTGFAEKLAATNSGVLAQQRVTHFDLNDSHQIHSWLRATSAAFGRSIIGPGMDLMPDPWSGENATHEERDLLYGFYNGISGRDFRNISDWYPASAKIYRTAGQFRLFGQATWELRVNGFGEVVSYDVIPGFIWPNCNPDGTFKDPPFQQYVTYDQMTPLELDPDRLVMFMQPDFGSRLFTTDFESLAEYVLPTDIYLNLAMRSSLENHRTPFGIFSIGEHSTQDEVDRFSTRLDALYRGAANYGKSAVVVRGDTDFKTVSPPLSELPFRDGHASMQDEIEGVAGVNGAKLGRTSEVNRSNLKEIRRDYWETTHQPVVTMLADQMYLLIHQRIFGIDSWRPVFKSPDFLTQVEKATVAMRGRQWSALSTNEFRKFVYDLPPVEEEWASTDYLWPKNMGLAGDPATFAPAVKPGGGSNEIPDEEEPVDEPSTDSDAPERGDTDNTEDARRAAISEMRAYARFCLNRFENPHSRKFVFNHVPKDVVAVVTEALTTFGNTRGDIKSICDATIRGMEDARG